MTPQLRWNKWLWNGIVVPCPKFSEEDADKNQLLQYLSDPSCRNFYGACHSDPNHFLWFDEPSKWKENIKHRYRFVFLDGCSSGAGDLAGVFKAAKWELSCRTTLGDANNSPSLQEYENNHLRPSAFLGWKYILPVGDDYGDPPPPPLMQQVYCFPDHGHWLIEFACNWCMLNMTLEDAIKAATESSYKANSNPTSYSITKNVYLTANDQLIKFDPETQLIIVGYRKLKFNEYNHQTDWPAY